MAWRASVGYEKVTLPRLALIKVGFIFICSLDLSRLDEHPIGRVASFLFMPYLLIFVLIRMFDSLMLLAGKHFTNTKSNK
jgi:tryptophan-rich sensory protein